VLAKCAAGRERDWDFVRDAITARIVDSGELLRRVERLPVDAEALAGARRMLRGIVDGLGASAS
jgi:hypothetical protein